mgnify:CR=1 FL=1
MANIDKLHDDIVELQSQMAFAEDTVEALNSAIASQQLEITTLRRQVEMLKQRQEEQASDSEPNAAGPANERPPHY